MAGTTINKREDAMRDGTTRATRVEFNKLVADVDLVVDKVNAIILAAATDIAAVAALDDAAAALAAVVEDQDGEAT